jgi:hypothetical protein
MSEIKLNDWIKDGFCHSFSSAQKFMINPSAWLFTYGFRHRQPTNPAMQRGKTSEFVAYYIMKRQSEFKEHKPVEEIAEWHFRKNPHAYTKEECQNSIDIAKNFQKALQERQLTRIEKYQEKVVVDGSKYGLNYPIVAYTDFTFPDLIVDTKATMRCPSSPKISHVRQQCLYSKLYDKPTAILYATPKKHQFVDVLPGEVEDGFQECISTFKNIENYLKVCDTIEKAVMITPLNTDDYYFDYNMKQEAKKEWQTILKQ